MFLALNTVDGIAVRTRWKLLEPSRDSYDWSVIDAAVAAAASYNKKVTLHVFASVYGAPADWLYADGAQSYTYTTPAGATKTDPVPWDGVFLSRWSTFVSALSAHLVATGGMAQIHYVSVTAPVPEMSLAACADGSLGDEALPYDRATYLDAWKTSVQVMHSAFPAVAKLLPAPVRGICKPDTDGPAFYGDTLDYALGLSADGFVHYATDLTALGSDRMNGIAAEAGRAPEAFQFIWSASDDPTNRMLGSLRDAICLGLQTYQAGYFEVYKVDLQSADPDIQNAIEAIHAPQRCG